MKRLAIIGAIVALSGVAVADGQSVRADATQQLSAATGIPPLAHIDRIPLVGPAVHPTIGQAVGAEVIRLGQAIEPLAR